MAWGEDDYGQATPHGGTDYIALAAGGDCSLALKKFVCGFDLLGDNNKDCKVDLQDIAAIAQNWLIDCYTDPSNSACVPK